MTFNEFRETLLRVITSEDDGKAKLKNFLWHVGGGLVYMTLFSSLLVVRLHLSLLGRLGVGFGLHQIPISGCCSRRKKVKRLCCDLSSGFAHVFM